MAFLKFLRAQLAGAFVAGTALGLVLAIGLLFLGNVDGELSLDIGLDRSDGLWFLVLSPLLCAVAVLLVSPLSFLLHWFTRRLRGAKGEQGGVG